MSAVVENKNRKVGALKRWGAFLGIAALALFVVLLPFIIRGNYLVWADNWSDGTAQHATFLEYMFRHGIFGGAGGYDYNIGLGADYMTSFAYYMMFDPINLLLYVLPSSNFLLAYSILVCVRFLLSAVCMYIYLRNRGVRQTLSVMFSVAYMISGYSLFTFVRHPDLAAGAVYLPLVVLGLERAIDKNGPFLLIAFVFLTTVSSFYMTYMVTLFCVLYAVFYYVSGVRSRGTKVSAKGFAAVFFRTAGYYLLGLALASFLLLPVARAYLDGARGAGKGLGGYSFNDLFIIGSGFFASFDGSKYTAIMFNCFTLALAFAAIRVSWHTAHAKTAAVLALGVFIPLFGYVMNMFNYSNNRFTYMLSFCVFSAVAFHLNEVKSDVPQKKERNAMIKGVGIAAVLLAVLYALQWLFTRMEGEEPSSNAAVALTRVFSVGTAIALTAVAAFCGIMLVYTFYKTDFSVFGWTRVITYKRLLICFAVVTLASSLAFNVPYSSQFDDGTKYDSYVTAAETGVAALRDDGFVRLDTHIGSYKNACNRPLNNGYKGTVAYNTMFPAVTSRFMRDNGLYTFSDTLGMSGLNGRIALQALAASKYFYAADDGYVPAQYEPCDVADGLYVTDDYVRFGTVFPRALSVAEYEAMPEVERQYALLQAVVTEDGEDIDISPLTEECGAPDEKFVLGNGEDKDLGIEPMRGYELYVSFGISELPEKNTFFRVECGRLSFEFNVAPKGHQMYTGRKAFLLKLDETAGRINFKVLSGSRLSFDNVKIFAARGDEVISLAREAASLPHLTDTRFTSRGFSGTINSDGGVMLAQLPYSSGWSAKIDGEKVNVFSADGGLTGIKVPDGEHKIEFFYRTPGLTVGAVLSALSALAVSGLVVAFSVMKKRKKSGKNIVKNI